MGIGMSLSLQFSLTSGGYRVWAEADAAAEACPGTCLEGAGKSPSSAVFRVEFGLYPQTNPKLHWSGLPYLQDRGIPGKESILLSWSLPWVQAGVVCLCVCWL